MWNTVDVHPPATPTHGGAHSHQHRSSGHPDLTCGRGAVHTHAFGYRESPDSSYDSGKDSRECHVAEAGTGAPNLGPPCGDIR